MRYFIIFLLFLSFLKAEEEKTSLTIGGGLYLQTQPYKDVETLQLPSPIIFFESGIFYIRWTRVGAYFLGEKKEDYSWGLSLTAMPRTYGYEASDIEGMKEREDSWEGGLSLSAKADNSYIELLLLTDIISRNDSYVIKMDIGHTLKFKDFTLYPSLNISYQSAIFSNYYYGVTQEEVTQTRDFYSAKSGYQFGVQTYISYPLTEKLTLFSNLKIDKISQSARKSPLVEESYIYSGLFSLIYNFTFEK